MPRMIRDFAVGPRRVSRIIRETGVDPGRQGLAAGGEKGGSAGQELAGEGQGFGDVENLGAGGETGRGRAGGRRIRAGWAGGGPVGLGGGGRSCRARRRGWRPRQWRSGRRCRGVARVGLGLGGPRRREPGYGRRRCRNCGCVRCERSVRPWGLAEGCDPRRWGFPTGQPGRAGRPPFGVACRSSPGRADVGHAQLDRAGWAASNGSGKRSDGGSSGYAG